MDLISELMNFLTQISANPLEYSIVLYVYSILAAVILPIPVEFGLFLSASVSIIIKALILGAGKATGSILVFYLGVKVEGPVRSWSRRFRWFKWLVDKMEWLVNKLSYVGLYIILSIPLMVDTVPVYLFSIFNKEGKTLQLRYFALANFLAGFTRAMIVFTVFEIMGIKLL
ncbi:MAG: hypothetical protein NT137_07475 [Methanomassiliicoccales archaeon]|nr:hypothetical protein [Methanomassiliicoccales archaeon]